MKLTRIAVQNFRSIASADVRLPDGLALITGDNGVGKSTLVGYAPAWCLWGEARSNTQDSLVRLGERECSVTVEMVARGEPLTVQRKFTLNTNGQGGRTTLTVHGQYGDLTQGTVRETQQALVEFIGPYDVWAATAYVDQFEGPGAFLLAQPAQRRDILRTLLASTHNWDAWAEMALNRVKECEAEDNKLSLRIESIETEVDGGTLTREEEVERIEAQAAEAEAARLKAVADMESAKDQLAALAQQEEKAAEAERLSQSLAAHNRKVAALEEHRRGINATLAQEEALRQRDEARKAAHHKWEEDYAAWERSVRGIQEANRLAAQAHERRMEDWRVARDERERAITAARADVETALHRREKWEEQHKFITSREAEIEQQEKALAERRCYACRQPLQDDGDARFRLGEVKAALERVRSEQEGLGALTAVLLSTETMLKKAQAVPEPERPTAPVPAGIAPAPLRPPADPDLDRSLAALETAKARQPQVDEEYTTAHWEREQVRQDAEKAGRAIEEGLAEKRQALKDTINFNDGLMKGSEVRLAGLRNQAAELRAEVKRIKSLAEQLPGLREQQTAALTSLEVAQLVAKACGPGGVRQLVIDQAIGALQDRAQRWLNVLSPGFAIYFQTLTDTGRETFDETVLTPTGSLKFRDLSGGQSVGVALAVRLALGEVAAASHGIEYGTLVLDEADSWLVGERQDAYLNTLRLVAENGVNVLCVSHIDDVKDRVDQVITLAGAESGTEVMA